MTPTDSQEMGLLREVLEECAGLDCYPCIGSHSPFEDLCGRIKACLDNTRPREDSGVVDEWRPIETAPRDGTRIIIGRPDSDGDGGISVCGYWLDELEDGVDYMGNDGGFTDVDYQVFYPSRSMGAKLSRYAGRQPTHWRPLPAPPALAAELGRANG